MPNGTITINTIASPQQGQAFTVTGTYKVTPAVAFKADAGATTSVPLAALSEPFSFSVPGLPAGGHTVTVNDASTGASNSASFTVQAPPAAVFIGANQSFTDAAGNKYRLDGELNAYRTPAGGTEVSMGTFGDIGWNALAMAYYNSVVYIQDSRDNTWHTFNGTAYSAAVAAPPGAPVAPPPAPPPAPARFPHATFLDDFSGSALSLYNHNNPAAGGTWMPAKWYGPDWDGNQVNKSWMVNPFATPALASLYATDGQGNAVLGFQRTPASQAPACGNQPFVGAQISSRYSQLHGYFEARLKVPSIAGTNFAFWLMNSATWPPEIDVLEYVNGGSWFLASSNLWTMSQTTNPTYNWESADFGGQFHTYGCDWQADKVTYYLDGKQTAQFPTPTGYDQPMFMILSCQQGGDWSGDVPATAAMGNMVVDYVVAYPSKAAYDADAGTAPAQPTVPAPAASVGYTRRTYGPNVTLGQNWVAVPGSNLTQNADGSVTDHGGVPNHFNSHATTGDTQFGGGCYVEGVISFQGVTNGWSTTVDGWPAFWGTGTDGSKAHVECDFFEFMTAGNNQKFDFGLQDWHADGSVTWAGDGGYGVATGCFLPAGFDPSQKHTYGFLWVPAASGQQGYAKVFVDGVNVGPTYKWSGPTDPWGSIDANTLQLIFGTGSANPMTVYSVSVYQK